MTLMDVPSARTRYGLLVPFIAMLALTLAVLFPLLSPLVALAMADTLLAALAFHGLVAAGLSALGAMPIVVLSFAQAGLFVSALDRAGSIWLALAVYGVAAAASGYVRHRDARHVILLGAALSLAQLLDPMGIVFSVFLLPVCVGLPRRGEGKEKAGLLTLLLFFPLVTALVLAYVRSQLHVDPATFLAMPTLQNRSVTNGSFVFVVLAGVLAAPALWLTVLVRPLRRPAARMAVLVAAVALAEAGLGFWMGPERDMVSALAIVAASSLVAMSNWPYLARKADLALAASALAAVVSWLLINLPVGGA